MVDLGCLIVFFFSSRRRHTRSLCDWSSDVCSSDLLVLALRPAGQWPAALEGKPEAVVGELDSELGRALVYDALIDADLGLPVLAQVAPDVHAERARPLLG